MIVRRSGKQKIEMMGMRSIAIIGCDRFLGQRAGECESLPDAVHEGSREVDRRKRPIVERLLLLLCDDHKARVLRGVGGGEWE